MKNGESCHTGGPDTEGFSHHGGTGQCHDPGVSSSIEHRITPGMPCPEVVRVTVITDGSHLLLSYPQGELAAFVACEDICFLRQEFRGVFGSSTGETTSENRKSNGIVISGKIGSQERGAMPGRHRYRRIATLREILDWSRRPRPPAVELVCTIEFADGPTGIAHRVAAEAFAAGLRAGGRYVALCGAQVLPERLTAPARFHCPVCERGF